MPNPFDQWMDPKYVAPGKYDEFEADQHMRGQLYYMEPPTQIIDRLGRTWTYDGWITDNGQPTDFVLRADPHGTNIKMIPIPDEEYWKHFPFYKREGVVIPMLDV